MVLVGGGSPSKGGEGVADGKKIETFEGRVFMKKELGHDLKKY